MNESKLFATLTLSACLVLGGGAPADAGDKGRGNGHGHKGHGNGHGFELKKRALENDFALFDGSNPANQPDAGAICGARAGQPFTYHLALANYGSDGFARITYADGDFVQFPIKAGESLSLTQAGGSRSGNDAVVRVSNGASAASLAGVLSAQGGTCGSCDAIAEGGLGDAVCDEFAPN